MLTEDLDVLFSGPDAVDVTIGASSYKALLDKPDQLVSEGMMVSTEYELTMKTSDLAAVEELVSEVVIDGDTYTIRSAPRKFDDGLLSKVLLSKE
jgi:hypothetical protein